MLPGALELAEKGTFSGGMKRNGCISQHYARCARAAWFARPSIGAAARSALRVRDLGGLFFAVAPPSTRAWSTRASSAWASLAGRAAR